MRVELLIEFALVACVSALVEVQSHYNYHERFGIPETARIKASEDAIMAKENIAKRIVGGAVAAQGAHPYLAGLLIELVNGDASYCGSSLLTANRLVTAAHCWFDGRNQASLFTVVLGSEFLFFGGTRIATSKVVMHPRWDTSNLANDIAIIYLPKKVVFTANIQPVSLPSTTQVSETFAGKRAVAAGYGNTSDRKTEQNTSVREVWLKVMADQQCQEIYRKETSVLCTDGTGGVGICEGDSGGPLVVKRNGKTVLIGISSFGLEAGCQLGYPSGFTRVTSFYNFILQHLK